MNTKLILQAYRPGGQDAAPAARGRRAAQPAQSAGDGCATAEHPTFLQDATSFLYAGSNAVQFGMTPGAIGAGAGGFLMFYAPPDRHDATARALPRLRRMDFHFEPQGSRIIFVHH